ncbi:MAG: Nif3-like dinuclear metal center hexameric protein, partial [Armatimonadia bacterium]
PVTLRELVGRVKTAMGMDALRVSGDLEAVVSRVGCPWGGVGLSLNVSFIEAVIAKGANGLIAGESDEYAMRYAADAGVPLIETSHAGSENPGLRHFCEHLRDHFAPLRVLFCEVPPAWTCL